MAVKKITRKMIDEMNVMVMSGIPKTEVARKMGISVSTVKIYASAKPPEKASVNNAWQIPWSEEWNRARYKLLGIRG